MKSTLRCLLLLGAGIVVLGVVIIDDETVQKSWLAFKREHGKFYASIDEEMYRRSVFEKALQRVFLHQLAFDRGEETYEIGINRWSDMTFEEEFVDDRKIVCSIKRRSENSVNATDHNKKLLEELGNPPAAINWQDDGYVSMDLRDQYVDMCGGCYAFGAVASIESAWAIKKKLKNKVPNLSEQQAIDCSGNYGCSGCAGGHPCGIYDMVKAEGGMMSEADYPWRKDQKKTKCQFDKSKVIVTISGYKEFDSIQKREETLVLNVGLVGPTTASVCASKSFDEYKQGIYNDKNCFTDCKKGQHNDGVTHTVTIIGYTKEYFIIRNSYGAKWGENGNMRIARTQGTGNEICNLGYDQSYAIV